MRKLSRREQNTRLELLNVFSKENWDKLASKRSIHSIQECKGCFRDAYLKSYLAKFPINDIKYKGKATKAGLFKEKILSDITNIKVLEMNQEFRTMYNTSFVKQAKKYVDTFKEIKSKEMSSIGKGVTKDCEKQFAETKVKSHILIDYSIHVQSCTLGWIFSRQISSTVYPE